ncbi:MAG: SPASM domain-containing protein [Desulfobacterales bacterium]|nr:MAG: SPASM domain-containing protein [Desulfobacterales bacterium]
MPPIQTQFPKRINIQTQSGCNSKCVFCPSPQVTGKIPMGRMDWDLFKKIVDECARHEMERINPYSQNEPLLDKEIAKRVAYIKDKCGERVTALIVSNGSLLTEKVMNDFIDVGLDRLKISLQGLTRATYQSVMVNLKHDQVYANVAQAIQILKRRNARKPRLSVSTVTTAFNEREIRQWKRYWHRKGIRATAAPCENRGGNIAPDEQLYPYGLVANIGCKRPRTEAVVVYNGDVVLCCVDWWRTVRLGNLREQSLEEIWNGAEVTGIRRAHAQGDVALLPEICRNCRISDLAARQHIRLRGLHQRFIAFLRRRGADFRDDDT